MLRSVAGLGFSLIVLAAGLWTASKALEAGLMGVVWVVQVTGNAPSEMWVDPYSPQQQELTAPQTVPVSRYALHAAGALGLAVLGAGITWGLLRLRRRALGVLIETSLTRFVGTRYILARERKTLLSLITFISVSGIAVGVTALIVVISVIEGFDQILVQRTMGVFSHVEIWPANYERGLPNYEQIIAKVKGIEGVKGASAIINQQTFFQKEIGIERDRTGGLLRGLDPKAESQVTTIMDNIRAGGTGSPGDREVVVGNELARRLDVAEGDTIWALGKVVSSPHRGAIPKLMPLKVVGVFTTGLYDIDGTFAYANLDTVQKLFVMKDPATGGGLASVVHLKIDDPNKSFEVARRVADALGRGYYVRTWQQINPQFFEALRMEKMAMFITLLLIVLVASFNIAGTLIMVVSQKTREIGILKSMGATKMDILRIFLLHGLIIGVAGSGLGLSLGLRLCWFVEKYIDKIYQLPGNVYYGLDRLPVVVEPRIVALILGASLAISLVASVIPAAQASRMNPVEALRYE